MVQNCVKMPAITEKTPNAQEKNQMQHSSVTRGKNFEHLVITYICVHICMYIYTEITKKIKPPL